MSDWATYSRTIAAVVAAMALGCSTETTEGPAPGKPSETGAAEDKQAFGKADAWNRRNNPNGLRVEMNRTLSELPLAGQTENNAWPDTYWPTYKDSTNARWQSTGDFLTDLSPMEKYDAAFNGWDPNQVRDLRPFDPSNCAEDSFDDDYYNKLGPAATFVSVYKGNLSTRKAAKAGELASNCTAKDDSECMTACADIEEESDRERCEDRCDRGGVETWWGLCHAWAPAAILEKEPLFPVTIPTEHGDIVFTIADIKALYSVIYDRSDASLIGGRCNDFEVKRDETTGRIISDECRDLNAGSFHVTMSNLIGLQKRGFVEDRTFDYEVWNQPVKGYTVHTLEEITVADAHSLLNVDPENPTDCLEDVKVAEGDYCYNNAIDQLYKVEATLDWITESHASAVPEGAENLRRYSRSDRYTYILEVKEGEVVGGEWYGDSIENHPDFVWLPFRPLNGNHQVSIAKVRQLGQMSQIDPDAPPAPLPEILSVQGENLNISIPDHEPVGILHTLNVGDAAEANAIKVHVDITHTYIGDLVITLLSPSGQEFVLHNKEGGSSDDIKKTFTVDDPGLIVGAWTLSISDNYRADVGTLNAWSMEFVVDGQEPVSRSETYANERVAEIPDNSIDGINSYIDISGEGTINGLELTVDISHTYISDLEITLKKGGVSKVISNREGGSDDDIQRTFKIDEFNGQQASGRWFLHIKDLAHLDVGTRNRWALTVTR